MQQPQNFSLYGAVDLGARQAAAQRQQAAQRRKAPQAGEAGVPANGHVFEVTDATFEADVLDRSRTVPVVMDLWAEWCGPCKQLGPVLEKLAAEAAGDWLLAKVDVDANPQLSAALQVQSIPMVLGVIGGQLFPGFLGALPEAQVRQWLGQLMQVAQQLGLPGAAGAAGAAGTADDVDGQGTREAPGAEPGGLMGADPDLAEAQQAMERGDLDGAAAAFERMLASAPGHPVATLGLAQVNLFRRVNSYRPEQLRREAAAHPDDVEVQCKVADIDLSLGKADEAFDRLLGLIRRSSGEERDKARRHLVGLFEIFPPRDPRVTRARATLSSLLF
ncbi:MAG TPA: tetratricopeptide repeat protein [Streptosporangiaceae bacterium]|nr:tetratricopeptide repeat protein [Streptosporangiaceae bacterium]